MSVLKTIAIKLEIENNILESHELAYKMNQYLLGKIDKDYALILSDEIIKPYTQNILQEDNSNIYVWIISSLNKTSSVQIVDYLMNILQIGQSELLYTDDAMTVKGIIKDKNYIHSITYKQLVNKYFANNINMEQIRYEIKTPYICGIRPDKIIPTTQDIIANLLGIWNFFAENQQIYEQGLVEKLTANMERKDYNFNLKPLIKNNQEVITITGYIDFALKNDIMSKKILAILTEYANYIGLGKYTDQGLGMVTTLIQRKK